MKTELTSKKHEIFKNRCLLCIRLINDVLKLFPFGLIIAPVIWFYCCPEYLLSEMINDWQGADMSGKIHFIRLYLESIFVLTVVAVFIQYLVSDVFMPENGLRKNGGKYNE
ncbi:hypothetical protein IQ454_004248 [Salmonella enterica]|nr:hypothetical protein [Salmonella enterica]EGL4359474.1 hypothetical protein [Salmonella enterica]EGL4382426.1 hypothetical protein [Salmonella enterica]EGL4487681.1 hypothetical protein [Salmonella enterica]EGL4515003.1 hypothetical protein [Salmonella enterica]